MAFRPSPKRSVVDGTSPRRTVPRPTARTRSCRTWNTVQHSCEAAFYSETDWERLRLELWFANHTMASGRPSDQAWAAIQHGLNELLLSPAVKRRGGIELKRVVDVDEYAAVSMVGGYRQALKSV